MHTVLRTVAPIMKKFTLFVFCLMLAIASCSKDGSARRPTDGTYKSEYGYPFVTVEIKNSKCVKVSIESQFGNSAETGELETTGHYPKYSYKTKAERLEGYGMLCDISASYESPKEFNADLQLVVFTVDDKGYDFNEAYSIPKMKFNLIAAEEK